MNKQKPELCKCGHLKTNHTNDYAHKLLKDDCGLCDCMRYKSNE
jgi:hypothetical protein